MSHINKQQKNMTKPSRISYKAGLLTSLALMTFTLPSLRAEQVYVTSCIGTVTLNNCPPSCPTNRGTSTLTSTVSSAPGLPFRDRAAFGVTNSGWGLTPTLAGTGGYKIYITKGTSGNASPDLIVNLTSGDGVLADTNGVVGTSLPITAFRAASSNNVWIHVGYITNTTTTPTIWFSYASGAKAATGGRWYMDGVQFESLDPCSGVAPIVGVTGPLAAGQTNVNVTGVVAGATNVTVYAETTTEIGQTNFAGGFAAGTVSVPTTALVKDNQITATQTKTNSLGQPCTSQQPLSGSLVGGGANTRVRLSLGLLRDATLTGPAGANTAGGGTGYWLKATGTYQGASATAPVGGAELFPDACWQTVTFQWGVDPGRDWQANTAVNDANPFAALEHLAFAIDDTDAGPYDIYVDDIRNGNVVIENFEGYTNGAGATFVSPKTATVPAPGSTYLDAPNSAAVDQGHVFEGTNACRIQWQFKDTVGSRWVRCLAASSLGKKYPQLDTSKPVTMHVLVLPVGTTVDHKFAGTVSSITNSATAYTTSTNVLGATITGTGPFTYQWSFNNGGLANPTTDSAYIIGDPNGIGFGDAGIYTLAVNDGTCTETRTFVFTNIDPLPTITSQPTHAIVTAGNTANFAVAATGHVPGGEPLGYQWQTNDVDITDATNTTLSIPNAQIANAGPYHVIVSNGFGFATSVVVHLDVAPIGVAPGNGTGLLGAYYTTHFPSNAFISATGPTLSRVDPSVDFDFGAGSPSPSVSTNNYTTRWTGQVQALGDDTYTFSTISDDGVRLWVNGQILVDNWTAHAPVTNSGSIALSGSQKYNLQLEYFEATGGSVAKLWWSNALGGVTFEPIPTQQLYPAASSQPAVPTLGFLPSDGTNIVFSWGVGQGSIAWSTNVLGPYTNKVNGVVSPYTFTNAIGGPAQKFFRLQLQ